MTIPGLVAALSLCAQAGAADGAEPAAAGPPRVECGVVVRAPGEGGWVEVDTGAQMAVHITVDERSAVVWHLDGRTPIPRADLRPGTRIRFVCPGTVAERVEVVTLGPLAMEAAVEEFVADSCGGRPWRGLTAPELAAVEALGSPSHLVRQAVSRALREAGPRALRPLIWARRHGDPEVRARAAGLLREMGWEGRSVPCAGATARRAKRG